MVKAFNMGETGQRTGVKIIDFAKHVKIRLIGGFGRVFYCRQKGLPKCAVNMFGCVNAKAVNTIIPNPVGENLNKTGNDFRMLGH